jgi:hypothetical protein
MSGINLEEKVFQQTGEIATLISGQANLQGEVKEIKKDLNNFFSTYAQDQLRNENERKANFADLHKTLKETMDLKVSTSTFADFQVQNKVEIEGVKKRLLPLETRLEEENTLITKSIGVKEFWNKSSGVVKGLVGVFTFITSVTFLTKAKDFLDFLEGLRK